MRLARLSLAGVRSFSRLDLEFGPGVHVLYGENATGKSNFLEAISLLSTARSPRGGRDGELIGWEALREDLLPAAQLGAVVELADGSRSNLEITVMARSTMSRPAPEDAPAGDFGAAAAAPAATRRFRVNGIARRASDLIGRLRTVLFSADDMALIDGPPSGRRRLLDVTISQLEPNYVRALQRYGRVLAQRTSLLRRLQERRGDSGELDFWDEELAAAAAVILHSRATLLARLSELATVNHQALSPSGGTIDLVYHPAAPEELAAAVCAPGLEGALLAALRATRAHDVRRGVTHIGPHRDDLDFLLQGRAASAYASRGEQRTVALALRLAEVQISRERTGEAPVLLLDDILSELDARRRARVLDAASGVDQVFITTPDEDRPSSLELPRATRYHIEGGALTVDRAAAPDE
ncbi:MAG: DNA replication/repair protein RecF [Dehalococcoidia bacterium]|nr:DNA replication/repair protein RecF [Dehalococcoidia bacterium]